MYLSFRFFRSDMDIGRNLNEKASRLRNYVNEKGNDEGTNEYTVVNSVTLFH